MANLLLVHGAWHGAWCWEQTVAQLEARGHRALAFDLPGHGNDPTPAAAVTLDDYARATVERARSTGEPVVAVGHSMGGQVISNAAERDPDAFRGLVYLCALLPRDGDALASLGAEDPNSLLNANIVWGEGGAVSVKPGSEGEVFYTDCTPEQISGAVERLCVQPPQPLAQPAELTAERFGRIPRAYVECLRDQAITIDAQRKMIERVGCDRVVTLDTGHSPFLSAPADLADHLAEIAAHWADQESSSRVR